MNAKEFLHENESNVELLVLDQGQCEQGRNDQAEVFILGSAAAFPIEKLV